MEEIWKDCVGYEGRYKVSNLGRVKSLERIVRSGKGNGIRKIKENILSPSLCGEGYPKVNFPEKVHVHRLVAIAFISNKDNKRCVNHIDSIRTNNTISNLEWVTHQENSTHASISGRMAHGEKSATSKLTEKEALEIKNSFENQYVLAKRYGITQPNISAIQNGKSWKHLTYK